MAASLCLGDVVFSDFEIPETLAFGARQRLVIHELPGGGRVVDAMGSEDAPIQWTGVFAGQQAVDRVRLLEQVVRSGTRQLLIWGPWRFYVIVQEFIAEVTSSFWIPYRIQLCPVADPGLERPDWLASATGPALTTGLLAASALEAAIGLSGAGLASNDIGQAIGSAGDLAQYVTARAFGLTAE
ncbi:MAG: hypothetical protein RQ966_18040 [Acetobacteraceae bacterium]|nr:hypothetical protein [Acetobacteraceae bacterium]